MLPALPPALAENPAVNSSPAGFRPPPPSAPVRREHAGLLGVPGVETVLGNEGLLFHSRLCSQSSGYVVEVPHLVPLVGGESSRRLGDKGLHLYTHAYR